MITKWFLANHQLSTDLISLYQEPFAPGLANPLCGLDMADWLPFIGSKWEKNFKIFQNLAKMGELDGKL